MSTFKDFIGDNNIKISDKGGLYSYTDKSGQEWLINHLDTEFELPSGKNQLCEFTATNGAGFVDTPIKGNRDDLQFVATFKEGIELLRGNYEYTN